VIRRAEVTGREVESRARSDWTCCLVICLLALAAYWRSLSYPFIADDYVQIRLARQLGSPENWAQLAADPLYRCRATSLYLARAIDVLFGGGPLAPNGISLVLHMLTGLLVMALARTLGFDRAVSVTAAGFFAVYERHQEAVIWYSALPELLVVAFSLGSLICWSLWCSRPAGAWRWYAWSLALFVGAMLSKESSVAVVPLLLLLTVWRRARRWGQLAAGAAPFVALAVVYAAVIFRAGDQHLFFRDGTFTLGWHVFLVLPQSLWRTMFFWGLAAAAVVGIGKTLGFSLAWMVVALLPYSFLTYMGRIPSRHHYFAAVGLALLIGAAGASVRSRWGARRPWLAPTLAAALVAHNCVYLWVYKHDQYMERATPTVQLEQKVRALKNSNVPLVVLDFPYNLDIVHSLVLVSTRRPSETIEVFDHPLGDRPAVTFRWDRRKKELIP